MMRVLALCLAALGAPGCTPQMAAIQQGADGGALRASWDVNIEVWVFNACTPPPPAEDPEGVSEWYF